MIDLYYWTTPNGHKITIFFEESGLPYNIVPVNLGAGEQFKPEFLRISPNNRMPAIVDHAPMSTSKPIAIFESGAILQYLAEKSGQFMGQELHARFNTLQWLYWQVGGLGPMAGQAAHFIAFADQAIPYAIDRYVREVTRLYSVLNKQLADKEFITGSYSIADMACYPWIVVHKNQNQDLADYPHLQRWFDTIRSRPAVQRAYEIAKSVNPETHLSAEAKKILFGHNAHPTTKDKPDDKSK